MYHNTDNQELMQMFGYIKAVTNSSLLQNYYHEFGFIEVMVYAQTYSFQEGYIYIRSSSELAMA